MRLMIDTNIFLDVLCRRELFFENSRKVLSLCEEKRIEGCISASSVTDIFYLIHRSLHNTEETYAALDAVFDIADVLTVTREDVLSAFEKRASDFEDCLLAENAKSNNCLGIITRNKKDFVNFGIELYSPEEIIAKIENQ